MKNILKDGMIVELRDGSKFLMVRNTLVGYLSHNTLDYYNDDLTYKDGYQNKYTLQTDRTIEKHTHKWDIIKIWEPRQLCHLVSMLEDIDDPWTDRFCDLIYDREWGDPEEDTVELTVEEISKLIGKNVKVIK